MNKREIERIVNSFPEIKQYKEQRKRDVAFQGAIEQYVKTLPTIDNTRPGEFIINLLEEIYDVYCGNKEEVDLMEVFKMSNCARNADEILSTSLYEYEGREQVFPVYFGNLLEDLDDFNIGLHKELKEIACSYSFSDELVYALIKESCEWLIENDTKPEFIKELYNDEEVDKVLDGIEFINAILKYKDEIRKSLDEEKNIRSMGWGDFEPITCLDNIVERLDYKTIRGLIYVEPGEFSKCDFINDCKVLDGELRET